MLTKTRKITSAIIGIASMILWIIALFWLAIIGNVFLLNPSSHSFTLLVVLMFAAWHSISIVCDKIVLLQLDRTISKLKWAAKESEQEKQ